MKVEEEGAVEFLAELGDHAPVVEGELGFFDLGEFHRRVAPSLGVTLQPGGGALDRLEIREDQLGLDGRDVTRRIDAPIDVDDVVVLKDAHDLADGVRFTNGREELVAQTFAGRCAAYDARDVHEGDGRRDDLL